jgi:hypothetical protein
MRCLRVLPLFREAAGLKKRERPRMTQMHANKKEDLSDAFLLLFECICVIRGFRFRLNCAAELFAVFRFAGETQDSS